MTQHVYWCRGCRLCRPIDEFPTAGADRCNACKAKRAEIDAAKAKALTPLQVTVVELMCLGYSNAKIGKEIHRSPLTVKGHVGVILDKLDANNRTYAAVLYTVKKIKDQI